MAKEELLLLIIIVVIDIMCWIRWRLCSYRILHLSLLLKVILLNILIWFLINHSIIVVVIASLRFVSWIKNNKKINLISCNHFSKCYLKDCKSFTWQGYWITYEIKYLLEKLLLLLLSSLVLISQEKLRYFERS